MILFRISRFGISSLSDYCILLTSLIQLSIGFIEEEGRGKNEVFLPPVICLLLEADLFITISASRICLISASRLISALLISASRILQDLFITISASSNLFTRNSSIVHLTERTNITSFFSNF